MPSKNPIQFLNQVIPTSWGILIVGVCLVIAGGILTWQFIELQQELNRLILG